MKTKVVADVIYTDTMKKTEQNGMPGKELTLLRPMIDQRKQCYKIMKKTNTRGGGWARFGAGWYSSLKDAIATINHIVANDPDNYAKEDQS
jgi:hypothetical protein